MTYGKKPRDEAQCPHCSALERHRLVWLFFEKKTDLFDAKLKKMLHVAPELCFESRFKAQLGDNYLTADLFKKAMVKMDICDIQYSDESFDVIYCSHVLEHVPDDKQAMREFCRVLKKNGWAILNVPINGRKTFEDSTIVTPQERLKAFGQEDHVRWYGQDYIERLSASGFKVKTFKTNDLVSDSEAKKMGISAYNGAIYYCTKK